ncbi:hypothetical protein CEXT_507351 [Caerostris extrusa]|uniref:Uncharacterized protein n=1 Tax=Caerostris extrusa TaxID=172846 RepID=A0AAV4M8A0_CAEEX|nr:hypothetical protein CEXT_507351 [Caerostris extrusa]
MKSRSEFTAFCSSSSSFLDLHQIKRLRPGRWKLGMLKISIHHEDVQLPGSAPNKTLKTWTGSWDCLRWLFIMRMSSFLDLHQIKRLRPGRWKLGMLKIAIHHEDGKGEKHTRRSCVLLSELTIRIC